MRIQNNIMAMNTHRQLGINNENQTKSTEKLSSGYKINRAADDAAGLYISEKMRSQIRGLNQASANAQDGISLIQAAEGALQETHSILQRMRELAVKAGNDVNETEDRGAIKAELNQLTKEVDRIAYTTEFNKKTLLDGSLTNGSITAKTVSGSGVAAGVTVGAGTAAGLYNIEVAPGAQAQRSFTINMTGAIQGEIINIATSAFAPTGTGSLLPAGTLVTFEATGNVEQDNATAVNMMKDALQIALGDYFEVSSKDNVLTITANQAAATKFDLGLLDGTGGLRFTTTAKKADGTASTASMTSPVVSSTKLGGNATVSVNGTGTVTPGAKYGTFTWDDGSGNSLTFTIEDVTRYSSSVIKVDTGRSLTLQVGANSSVDQTIGIAVKNMSAAALGIDNLSVHNNEASRAAQAAIDLAIAGVSEQRSALGAVQNRLEHTVANLDTVAENLTSAESRIRDVDMAKEMMAFTKNNILSQAATAMLAQANQAPQTVLQLLR